MTNRRLPCNAGADDQDVERRRLLWGGRPVAIVVEAGQWRP